MLVSACEAGLGLHEKVDTFCQLQQSVKATSMVTLIFRKYIIIAFMVCYQIMSTQPLVNRTSNTVNSVDNCKLSQTGMLLERVLIKKAGVRNSNPRHF